MKKQFLILCMLVFVIGCKSISVNHQSQITTKTPVILGGIGLAHTHILENHFENITLPDFGKPQKLLVQTANFTTASFKAFAKANTSENKLNIQFSDSLPQKPQYVLLQFLDRVAITDELNSTENKGIRNYLETKENAQLVTGISIAYNSQNMIKINKAAEVFLLQSSTKKYSLQLVDISGKEEILQFSEGVIFAYQLSGFCWKENEKHQLCIADIVNGDERCPVNTHSKASKVIQSENYFKL